MSLSESVTSSNPTAADFDVESLFGRRADKPWNRFVIGDMWERLRYSHPHKTALIGRPGTFATEEFAQLTYEAADDAANRVARALLAEGLSQGDRVLIYCDNSIEAVVLMVGIAKAGLAAVPLNPLLAPDVVTWAIEHVEPAFAVVDGGLWPRAQLAFERSGLRVGMTIPIEGGTVPGSAAFADWIAPHEPLPVDTNVHTDDVWSILFTSGTTAMPKAVMFTHMTAYVAAFMYALSLTRGLEYEQDLRHGTFLPIIYHCGFNSSITPSALCAGTTVLGRRPNATGLAEAISDERVNNIWAGAPAWVQQLVDVALDRPDEINLRSLRVAMFSWGAMSPTLGEQLRQICGPEVRMLEVFGQTESMSSFRFWPDQQPEKHQQTLDGINHVGVPTPILAADIVDPEGRSLRGRPGIAGEAVYRSPVIANGYYRNLEATQEVFRGGWLHSGDSCMYDEDGEQIMVDRFKDIVKSGGENVASIRVESVVNEHPGIARSAVIGLPDPRWGEMVTAVVTTVPGAEVTEADVIEFARGRLAGYETPKRVIFVEEMPETVGGKILKYELRKRFADG
jgi:acyl-CoA synthetase (AMP-forming)/AMP-acid ligase II